MVPHTGCRRVLLAVALVALVVAVASASSSTPASSSSTASSSFLPRRRLVPTTRRSQQDGSTASALDFLQRVRGGGASPKAASAPTKPAFASAAVAGHADAHHGLTIGSLAINIMADLCPHGMLPLAFGMASEGGTGLAPALTLLLVFGSLSAYTLISIARACEATGEYSFRGIWSRTLHPSTAWIIDAGITLLCFGCCIFYSAFIGDLSAALAQALGAPAFLHKRWVCLVGLHIFPLLPLCLMKNLSALQYSSIVGVLGILYTTAFVVKRQLDGAYQMGGQFHALIDVLYRPQKPTHTALEKVFRLGPGAISLMNMACVAFTTHYNGIAYYTELKDRSLPRYASAVGLGFLASFSIFALMMIFGFGTFGHAAQPLLLNNYHRTKDALATGSRLATAFSIMCGFPLMFAGLKTGFFSLWRSNIEGASRLSTGTQNTLLSEPVTMTVSTLLLASICGIAIKCTEEDVGFVIGLIGAVLGTGVVYIIPALLNTKLLARVKDVAAARPEKRFNHGLIAVGVIFACLGTYTAIDDKFGIFSGKGPKVHAH